MMLAESGHQKNYNTTYAVYVNSAFHPSGVGTCKSSTWAGEWPYNRLAE